MKPLATLACFVAGVSLLFPSIVRADPKVGADAPVFKHKTIDGKEINFPADYKGKLVIIDFWATWCGPCMETVPSFVKAYHKYHPKGLEILGFSVDKADAEAKVRKVMAEKHMTWDMCMSLAEFGGAVPKEYGINFIPRAFLVDPETGKVIANLNKDNIDKKLEEIFQNRNTK